MKSNSVEPCPHGMLHVCKECGLVQDSVEPEQGDDLQFNEVPPVSETVYNKSAPVSPQNKELDTTALDKSLAELVSINKLVEILNERPLDDLLTDWQFVQLRDKLLAWNKATVIEAQNKIADELLPDNSMVLAYMDETTAKASGLNYISRASPTERTRP